MRSSKTVIAASGFTYVCGCRAAAGNHKHMQNQRLQLQFLSFSWWAVCRSKHVEQLRNIGIIKSTTRSHLVGYFYKICIMIHGSMNITTVVICFVRTAALRPRSYFCAVCWMF